MGRFNRNLRLTWAGHLVCSKGKHTAHSYRTVRQYVQGWDRFSNGFVILREKYFYLRKIGKSHFSLKIQNLEGGRWEVGGGRWEVGGWMEGSGRWKVEGVRDATSFKSTCWM